MIPFTLGTLPSPSQAGRLVRLAQGTVVDTGTTWMVLYPLWSVVNWFAYFHGGHDALLGDLSCEC